MKYISILFILFMIYGIDVIFVIFISEKMLWFRFELCMIFMIVYNY